jgi:tetratricopeptide (TPR) repeat protein
MLIALHAKMGDMKKAEEFADIYLSKSDDADDMNLIATIKVELKKYEDAIKYLKKAYQLEPNDKTLMEIVSILEKRLQNDEEAIRLIRKHIKKFPDTSTAVYFKLIELYAKEKNFKKILQIYKDLYKKDPQKYFFNKIVSLSLYTNDNKGLIKFLEENRGDEGLLYMLYKEEDKFEKAIELAKKRYDETKEPKWLAEEAILIYEDAYQKKSITPKVLKRFQKLFEEALEFGIKDSLYLNYYGYILIDHDLNIEKGIELVKEALKEEPNNSYYLDSLAWGLYKLGKCKEAYKIMRKVIAKEGVLKENEMKTHWESIRECNKKIDSTQDMF